MSERPIPATRPHWGWIAVGALCAACCWWLTMTVLVGVAAYKLLTHKEKR